MIKRRRISGILAEFRLNNKLQLQEEAVGVVEYAKKHSISISVSRLTGILCKVSIVLIVAGTRKVV